jgi:FAD/FMN-containing dehydrogenase
MLAGELRQLGLEGEVKDDPEILTAYSHDASIFELVPEAVVFPKDPEDVKKLVRFAREKKAAGESVSLTARSGGTDMTGGPLSRSVVLDFSKHINAFRGFEGNTATAEPGMFYRDFERETLARGLLMPSYPASREICTIGGMVANNSGGEKTLAFGKTEDYVAKLKVVLADGEEHEIKALTPAELQAQLQEPGFLGDIYRKLIQLIEENEELIRSARPAVSKNSAGYYLWNVWDKKKGLFDLTKLLVGSQGTLGLVTEATFRLIRPKSHSLMAVIFLKDLERLGELVNDVLKFNPESFESYDDKTLKLALRFFPQILARAKTNPLKLAWNFLPDLWMLLRHGFPKLVLLVELTGEDEKEIYGRLENLEKVLEGHDAVFRRGKPEEAHHKILISLTRHQSDEEKYWITRRESFNLLRQNVKGKHTLPVIDDFVVKPEYLPQFLPELQAILDRYSVFMTATVAGHMGNGNFHVIPLMNFKNKSAVAAVPHLMDDVYNLVLKYKGSITAEHNDGLVRTPYLQKMYGPAVARLFERVKDIFDPQGIFNPGKKVKGNLAENLSHMRKDWQEG